MCVGVCLYMCVYVCIISIMNRSLAEILPDEDIQVKADEASGRLLHIELYR